MQPPKFELIKTAECGATCFSLDRQLAESIAKRHVLLLDTSAWIRLAESKDEISARILKKALQLKDAEKIFCPLTPATIWELRKQCGRSLLQVAQTMEVLSENVTFRSPAQLYEFEIESFLNYIRTGLFKPLSIEQKFGPLLSYIAPGYRLVEPATGEAPSYFRSLTHSLVNNIRLTTLIQMLGDHSQPSFPKGQDIVATRKKRRDLAGNSIDRARRIETEYVAQEIVLPILNRQRSCLEIEEQLPIVTRMQELPKSRRYGSAIEHILRFTPALSSFIEVQTVSGLDVNRRDSQNDFFDCDLLVYALSYVGTFCAIDRWVASLVSLSKSGSYPAYYAFAGNLESLEQHLNSIEKC